MKHATTKSLLGIAIVACLVCGGLTGPATAAEPFAVDAVHSAVLFRIKHMNTSYCWGRFNDIRGTVDLESPSPRVEVSVAATSVDTGNAQRDEHLRGPDYFNAKQFPAISFKSKTIAPAGDDAYDVTGDLTLHGVTQPVTLRLQRTGSARSPMTGPIVGYAAEFQVKRSDYGMKFMLGPLGDEVLLVVSLECAGK